jgi:GNAT superfamily N-acetyltransferase
MPRPRPAATLEDMTPATDLAVREARPDELPAVQALLRAAFTEHAGSIPGALFHDYLEDLARVGSGATLLVVRADDGVVATARLYLHAGAAGLGLPAEWSLVRAVGVDPAHRGAGLAAALMTACADRARCAGAPVLSLHTADFMTAAKHLYERLGYRPVPDYDFVAGRDGDAPGATPVLVRAYALPLDTRT